MSREEPVQWQRGLRLPERTKPSNKNHQTKNHENLSAELTRKDPPKPFVPAAPPKTNAWGSISQQAKVPIPFLASTMRAQAQEFSPSAPSSTSTTLASSDPSRDSKATTSAKMTMRSPWKTIPQAPPVSLQEPPTHVTKTPPPTQPAQQRVSAATVPATGPKPVWGIAPVSILTKNTSTTDPPKETKKKSKKGKPKLTNLQLGDLVPKNHALKKAAIPAKIPTPVDEFPALSATAPARVVKAKAPKPTMKASTVSSANHKTKPKSSAKPQKPPSPIIQDRVNDEAFSLLRQFAAVPSAPGRQRVKPRKKRFTSLKKKVLQERLRRWKELHPEDEEKKESTSNEVSTGTTIQLLQYLDTDAEILEDDEEYEEIVQNLQDLAEQCGPVKRVFVPRTGGPVFCDFAEPGAAQGALNVWNGLVLGGQTLESMLLPSWDTSVMEDDEWHRWCLNPPATKEKERTIVMLENALTEDDLEDEECLEESLADIRNLVAQHGTVLDVSVASGSTVKVTFEDTKKSAAETLKALSQLILGGQVLSAKPLEAESSLVEKFRVSIFLDNVLTDDDLEDEDALLESIDDIRELASSYGNVETVRQEGDDTSKRVRVEYANEADASTAYKAFQGMVIGGLAVVASRPEEYIELLGDATKERSDINVNDENASQDSPVQHEESKVMYSGDKIISERFAECKRVPKVLTQASPRHYAKLSSNPDVKPLLQTLLAELMRLQKRAVEENNTKAKRRLVMGLREVARGIRSHKVKMVVMATNLDEYGVIDEKLQEIIDLAASEHVPIFYEFTKRAMGKAIGKTIKVAVIGVQSAEGAHQEFKKLSNIAAKS